MNAVQIYSRTMKFVWLKLLLGTGAALGGGLIAGLFLLIGKALSEGAAIVLGILGIALGMGFWGMVYSYFGYLIKAGHVAVAAQAFATGTLPENQLEWATQTVKTRFATANAYYLLDRLVSGALSQLQRTVNSVGELLKNVPGMGLLERFASQLIETVLGNVDGCCLGWCFLHPQMGSFHASCDGVSIYFQNAKTLLKAGAKISALVTGLMAIGVLLLLLAMLSIFHGFSLGFAIAFVASTALLAALKSAFLDSYIMIRMMGTFLELAPNTVLRYDLYGKLCGLSAKFKKLFDRAREEGLSTL